jgi:uncharacterized protein
VVPQVRREPGVRALLQREKILTATKHLTGRFFSPLSAVILLLLSITALPGTLCAQTNLSAKEEYRQAMQICRNPRIEGIPLYQRSHAPEAVSFLESAAEKGYVPAIIHLGSHYLTGNGVEKSAKTAFQHYVRGIGLFLSQSMPLPLLGVVALIAGAGALLLKLNDGVASLKKKALVRRARPGNPKAQHALALRYLHGTGTYRQAGEARKLFEQAAEQGYAPAQVELGRFFEQGLIVQASRVQAAQWYAKAAKQGDAEGLFMMGKCYEEGAGVALYLPKALGYYLLAASRGHQTARDHLTSCQEKMTAQQQQAGQQFANEFSFELTGSEK